MLFDQPFANVVPLATNKSLIGAHLVASIHHSEVNQCKEAAVKAAAVTMGFAHIEKVTFAPHGIIYGCFSK